MLKLEHRGSFKDELMVASVHSAEHQQRAAADGRAHSPGPPRSGSESARAVGMLISLARAHVQVAAKACAEPAGPGPRRPTPRHTRRLKWRRVGPGRGWRPRSGVPGVLAI